MRSFKRAIARRGSAEPEDLRRQFHAPEGIGAEVLDRVGEDLIVAHEGPDVVRCIDRGHEQANLVYLSGNARRRDEVAHFERPKHQQERPGGKIGQ